MRRVRSESDPVAQRATIISDILPPYQAGERREEEEAHVDGCRVGKPNAVESTVVNAYKQERWAKNTSTHNAREGRNRVEADQTI